MLVDPETVRREWAKLEARAHLEHASAVNARLASLRFRIFDETCPPCTPGLHAVLVAVAGEIEARA